MSPLNKIPWGNFWSTAKLALNTCGNLKSFENKSIFPENCPGAPGLPGSGPKLTLFWLTIWLDTDVFGSNNGIKAFVVPVISIAPWVTPLLLYAPPGHTKGNLEVNTPKPPLICVFLLLFKS